MLSYSNRDFNSILNDLRNLIPQLTDKWTDFNKSDLGMVLLQTIAGISAMANFYIDKESNENFIGLAKEPKNIESILELIGYQKPLRQCAISTQVIKVNSDTEDDINRPTDIVIPKYFQVYDKDKKIPCFFANEVRIKPNEYEKEVVVYQGQCRTREYSNSVITGYKFYLPSGKYAQYPFRLIIDNIEWEQVDNAFLELEGGRKFSLHRDSYDSHYILLTYDYANYIDSSGKFKIEYVLTEGDINIPPLEINTIDSNITDAYGNVFKDLLTTYNKTTFTGGFTENDVYYERARLQRQLHVMDRLVTLEDYRNFVGTYPGIYDCEVSDISVQNSTNPKPYQIDIFVLPNTLTNLGEALRLDLTEKIKYKQDFRNEFFLKDPKFVYVDISMHFTTKASSNAIDIISTRIGNLIRAHFEQPRFKRVILTDELISLVIRNISEVYTLDLITPTYDIYPSTGEVVMIRDINITGEVYRYGL